MRSSPPAGRCAPPRARTPRRKCLPRPAGRTPSPVWGSVTVTRNEHMASAPVLYVKSPHPPSLTRHVKRGLFALCRKQFAQERTVKAPGGGGASNFGPGASQVGALQSSHALSECPSRVPYAYRSIDRSGLVGHSLRVLEEDPSWANNWMPRGGISAGRAGNPGRAWEPGEGMGTRRKLSFIWFQREHATMAGKSRTQQVQYRV